MAEKCDVNPDQANISSERLPDKSTHLSMRYGTCILQISALEAEKIG